MPYVKRTVECLEAMKKEELIALAAALSVLPYGGVTRDDIIKAIREGHPDEFE